MLISGPPHSCGIAMRNAPAVFSDATRSGGRRRAAATSGLRCSISGSERLDVGHDGGTVEVLLQGVHRVLLGSPRHDDRADFSKSRRLEAKVCTTLPNAFRAHIRSLKPPFRCEAVDSRGGG